MSRHDCITDADRLLGQLLYEHLPNGGERQIVHDDDPAGALIDRSRSAGLLVVGTRSRASTGDDILGATTTALLGNTRCPVAVLPH
jgi:nucleotide-binding universal stress UspA family protein